MSARYGSKNQSFARRQMAAEDCVAKGFHAGVGSVAIAATMRAVTNTISIVEKIQQVHTAFFHIPAVLHPSNLEFIRGA